MSNPQTASEQNHPSLLTIAEFASAIGKTERQIYRYIHQGRIEVVTPDMSGHLGIRIPRTQIERFKSVRKPSIQIVMSDTQSTDMSLQPVAPTQSVPLERHEAALMRLGAVEQELDQARKMLTDGGSRTTELASKVHTLEIELAQNKARSEMEAQLRQESDARALELTLRLSQAELKFRPPDL